MIHHVALRGAATAVLTALLLAPGCSNPHLCEEGDLDDCAAQCERDHAGSCERLGVALEQRGPSSGGMTAFDAYGKACDKEVFSACWRAGNMAREGRGTEKDLERSARLFRRACELGEEPEGCYGLGVAYAQGNGEQKNDEVAVRKLKLACDKGHGAACARLARMAEDHRIDKVDDKTVAQWHQVACEKGIAGSCCALGWGAEHGADGEKNEDRAIELYFRGCKADPKSDCCKSLDALDVSRETGKRTERGAADPGTTPASAEEISAVARGANDFALRFAKRLFAGSGNLVYSPASISLGASMVYGGARGETEKQMATILAFPLAPERFHVTYATILQRWSKTLHGRDTTMYVANRLFGRKGYAFEPSFIELTGTRYGAAMHLLDFEGARDESTQFINDWVAVQTKQRIKNILPPGSLSPMTRFVLVNAMYFKAKWSSQFSESDTKDEPFHVAAAKTVQVPTMSGVTFYPYARVGSVTIVELPYRGSECTMTLLIPDAIDGLPKVEAQLSERQLSTWLDQAKSTYVSLWLPKFIIHHDIDLQEALGGMGLTLPFDKQADLSGIANEPLFIDKAVHKAYIEVNEKGTEAAAATLMGGVGYGMPPKPVEVRADRPFLFLLRDKATGVILFAGRVSDPLQK